MNRFGHMLCQIAALVAWPGALLAGGAIQQAELVATRPYYVPTHPRVTTTIRFPGEIGAPDGSVSVFTEDATKMPAEYLVSWRQGDSYFTLTPLREASMANLNVPYRGGTYVIFVYTVPEPTEAVAVVNLVEPATAAPAPSGTGGTSPATQVVKAATPPVSETVPRTPARLLGLIDRLKLIHATPVGPQLASLAKSMGVDVAVADEELAPEAAKALPPQGAIVRLGSGLTDAGLYQLVLLRVVRDRRQECVGFVCLLRNTSDQVLAFDVTSFGARAGTEYLAQRISDAPAILRVGEQAAAYFVVETARSRPLRADNNWRVSVDLVSPRLNPGAAIAKRYGKTAPTP